MDTLLYTYLTRLSGERPSLSRTELNSGLSSSFSLSKKREVLTSAICDKLLVETKIPGKKARGRGFLAYNITEKGKELLRRRNEHLDHLIQR